MKKIQKKTRVSFISDCYKAATFNIKSSNDNDWTMFEQFHYLWILVNLIMSISSQSTSFCYFWHFYPKLFRILLHLSIMQTFPHRRIYQPDAISINGPRFDIVEIRSRYCRNEGTSWAEKHKHTPIHTHTPSHTPSHTHTHIYRNASRRECMV